MNQDKTPVVLTIDDDQAVRESLANFLEDFGYNVLQAEDGEHGLEVFAAEHPDLILVDLRMPRMDGMTLLREIKALKPTMPVILLTAYASAETELESKKIGAYEYRSKPFNVDKLLDTINNALQERKI